MDRGRCRPKADSAWVEVNVYWLESGKGWPEASGEWVTLGCTSLSKYRDAVDVAKVITGQKARRFPSTKLNRNRNFTFTAAFS